MPKQALVSIIIPTFNRADLIGETLDSILAQTYRNWECMVVDDGSKDDTKVLVDSYNSKDSRIRYYQRPNDYSPGGNGARNYGFTASKGDYIQWFDDDDVMLEHFLEEKINAFNDATDLVICSSTKVDSELVKIEDIDLRIRDNLYKDYVLWQFKIVTNNVLFKRSFLQNKDLFNSKILRGQESDFFSRLFFNLQNEQFKIINKPLFLYRQHASTKTKANEDYVSRYKTSEIYIASEHLKRAVLLNDKELIQYFYRQLIHFFFRALHHKDIKNAKSALVSVTKTLKPINRRLVVQLQIVGSVFLLMKRGIYKVEAYFKSYNI
ncbi:glycosyltransferase family 2 protein [Winogradskyella ouciana]|uniref:glycosyltransferase family 2 protein n=1 Tax=Winogradskyella ouciana TaxID=2608631 RepID=UPI003D2973EB